MKVDYFSFIASQYMYVTKEYNSLRREELLGVNNDGTGVGLGQ